MDNMASTIFTQWPDLNYQLQLPNTNTVTVNGESLTWQEIYIAAKDVSQLIPHNGLYIIDANKGIKSIVSLLATAMTPGCSFIWRNTHNTGIQPSRNLDGIYQVNHLTPHTAQIDRLYYGTMTSGSSSQSKTAMGYADHLISIGIYYSEVIYRQSSTLSSENSVIACCLPMEYSAAFMMALLPAWASARNLVFFSPNNWKDILTLAEKVKTVIVTAPCMLASASAYIRNQYEPENLTFLTTAGYLSQERVAKTKEKFPNARFQISYGSTETGIMTLGDFCETSTSVGKPLYGKSIWLREKSSEIGKITTASIDCREFYLESELNIRDEHGTVTNLDYGHFDSEGKLYLDGRVDKAVKSNGLLCYPNLIERFILTMPGVVDVKVHLIEKSIGSEYIEAVVIGNVSIEDISNHCEKLDIKLRPHSYKVFSEHGTHYSDRGKLIKQPSTEIIE